MDSARNQLADKLRNATNVLVTVSRNPSVDQLAACLGLTLVLNKLNKHAAAVFSGQIPSTLEFLQPEDTIEKNTDSLRDFIIALDKSKADKLRYKVEDDVVRIFITPYKTSISQDDLEFSQGDFNVDVVVALGVHQQEDLDEAITAHGRILHDATVATINTSTNAGLGSISWQEPQASSLSELVTELAQSLGDNLLDNQIATALLTGIVAETARFSNDKTSSQTMSISAALMGAGANQQLVASKLEAGEIAAQLPATDNNDSVPPTNDDGTLEISHDKTEDNTPTSDASSDAVNDIKSEDSHAPLELPTPQDSQESDAEDVPAGGSAPSRSRLITEPPTLGGALTANTVPEDAEPSNNPLSLPSNDPPQLLSRDNTPAAPPSPPTPPIGVNPPPVVVPEPPVMPNPPQPPSPSPTPASTPPPSLPPEPPAGAGDATLSDLEAVVHSPHLNQDQARAEVDKALQNGPTNEPARPIAALNAQPLGGNLHTSPPPGDATAAPTDAPSSAPAMPTLDVANPLTPLGLSDQPTPPPSIVAPAATSSPQVTDSTAPPPVPPPIPFQFGSPTPPQP